VREERSNEELRSALDAANKLIGEAADEATRMQARIDELELQLRPGSQTIRRDVGTEESRRLHRKYNALVEAQRNGAKNGADVVRLTDECGAKGIILVPGGEDFPDATKPDGFVKAAP
jgi:hypothetical protein